MPRKVLVTGGAGFMGRHLVSALLARGDEVHCVDRLLPGSGAREPRDWAESPLARERFHFHAEDCRDFFRQRDDDDFDLVFHLAAIVGGRARVEGDPLASAENLSLDAALWAWAQRTRPRQLVCFSSSAVYPLAFQSRESHRLLREDFVDFGPALGLPDQGYGWAKLTLEYFARLAHKRYGLDCAVYRPFSGYGEDQDDSYPFPSICRRALRHRGEPRLEVWGSGEQMRDFIHVDDCVRGVLATHERIRDGSALNLSTGVYTSFRAFASLVAEQLGYRPEVVGRPGEPEGVFARAGDTAKQASLGFRAEITLAEGVARALKAYAPAR